MAEPDRNRTRAACAIRPCEPADADHVYSAVRESLLELSAWMSWPHPAYSLDEARRWTAAQPALAAQGQAYEFSIWSDGRYVGCCGVNQINAAHRFANLGYWIRTSETGKGLAPAAVRLAARFAFERTGLVRLEIVCAVGNVRSQRVAEKAGAAREGVARDRLILPSGPSDAVVFSLTRRQWADGGWP